MSRAAPASAGQGRSSRHQALAGAIAICAMVSAHVGAGPAGAEGRDDPFRIFVRHATVPEYPAAARKDHVTGVVVVAVQLTPAMRLAAVDVLEAPRPDLGLAVSTAVRTWTFALPHSLKRLEGKSWSGKLTFYFFCDHGRLVVRTPRDAPNVSTPTCTTADHGRVCRVR